MSSISRISSGDLERIVETTTREILRGMNTSLVQSMTTSPSKIIETTTREILRGMNSSFAASITSSSSKCNAYAFNSSTIETSDLEVPSHLVSTLEKTVEITRWCLAICQLGGDCCIVGHIYHDGTWVLYRTSYIRSVHENRRLIYDDDGNYFHINGGLTPSTYEEFRQSESSAVQLTFLPETVAAFKNGIPPNYRMWVQRIAYEAQKHSSFSANSQDHNNEFKTSYVNDATYRSVRKEKADEDKITSIFGWEPGQSHVSDVPHVTALFPEANNTANVDIDAEDDLSEEENPDSDSRENENEEEEEEEEDSVEDLPSDGETCESHVSRKLSGNPFKTFFYDKMLERTQMALRKKRVKQNQRKSVSQKENQLNACERRSRKNKISYSDRHKKDSPNDEDFHYDRLSFLNKYENQVPPNKQRLEKSSQDFRQSFRDEENAELSSPDTGNGSLVMFSSTGELSNDEKDASLSSSFRDAWSVLHRAPSDEDRSDTRCDSNTQLNPVVRCQRLSPTEKGCERKPQALRKRSKIDTDSAPTGCNITETAWSAKRKKTTPQAHSTAENKSQPTSQNKRHHKNKKEECKKSPRDWRNISFFGAPKTAAEAENSQFVLRTLSGGQIDVRDLTRTRSGRLSRPPLDTWRGQRIATDSAGNITEVHHGQEDRLYSIQTFVRPKNSTSQQAARRVQASRQTATGPPRLTKSAPKLAGHSRKSSKPDRPC